MLPVINCLSAWSLVQFTEALCLGNKKVELGSIPAFLIFLQNFIHSIVKLDYFQITLAHGASLTCCTALCSKKPINLFCPILVPEFTFRHQRKKLLSLI